MATREENLKKINDELEKLSDEELDGVAGGSEAEDLGDFHLLRDLGVFEKRFGKEGFEKIVKTGCMQWGVLLKFGWNYVGIDVTRCSYNVDNVYYLGDKQITHDEAVDYAYKKFGSLEQVYDRAVSRL